MYHYTESANHACGPNLTFLIKLYLCNIRVHARAFPKFPEVKVQKNKLPVRVKTACRKL